MMYQMSQKVQKLAFCMNMSNLPVGAERELKNECDVTCIRFFNWKDHTKV